MARQRNQGIFRCPGAGLSLASLSSTKVKMLARDVPGCAQANENALDRFSPQSLAGFDLDLARNLAVIRSLNASADGAPAALDAPAPRNSVHSPLLIGSPMTSRIRDGISGTFAFCCLLLAINPILLVKVREVNETKNSVQRQARS